MESTAMLNQDQIQAAADLLWEQRLAGLRIVSLPIELRPTTREEGYAIQSLLERCSRAPLFGWKIAATSRAGQAHIGVDGPLAGRLLAEWIREGDSSVPFGANHMKVAEIELAFRMGRDLEPRPAPYQITEVSSAVDALYPAIEIPNSRYEDLLAVGVPQLLADDTCADYLVIGRPTQANWRSIDLAQHKVTATVAGKNEREGKGEDVLGNPLSALTWLANELSRIGVPLKAGQVVTTGTWVAPLPVEVGDEVSADFGVLGKVSVRLDPSR
jgi:2-keto-4-pentenoate hydratase